MTGLIWLLFSVVSWLYVYKGDIESFYKIGASKNNPLTAQRTSEGGIEEVGKCFFDVVLFCYCGLLGG